MEVYLFFVFKGLDFVMFLSITELERKENCHESSPCAVGFGEGGAG